MIFSSIYGWPRVCGYIAGAFLFSMWLQESWSQSFHNLSTSCTNFISKLSETNLVMKGNYRMNFRHEVKHEINASDAMAIRQRLRAVARADPHAKDGRYQVRSLYFDNLWDKALREKLDGVGVREKFRIRYYNGDITRIHLEKKQKVYALTCKESAPVTKEEVQAILQGRELYRKMDTEGLKPRTIVSYTREPFVFGPGNVRITLDYDIRTGLDGIDFFNPDCTMIPAGDRTVILEVKWDGFLPDIIRDAIQLPGRRAGAFSKYAACRIYG